LNRTTSGRKTDKRDSLDTLLRLADEQKASDIILVAGTAITLRVNGSLITGTGKSLSPEDLRNLLLPLLTADHAIELENNRALDLLRSRIDWEVPR
jgi:twitching motility protein PilT